MNNGLKIILERMKTNPEEFQQPKFRRSWAIIVEQFWDILTDEERTEYRKALREITLSKFEEEVLKELMRGESGSSRIVDYQERMRIDPDGNVGIGTGRQLTLPLEYAQEK
jgi:hypothetical protein